MNNYQDILSRPLEDADVVEWRIIQFRTDASGNPHALISAYFQSRTAMKRLDEAFGLFGWNAKYDIRQVPQSSPDAKTVSFEVVCQITVREPGSDRTRTVEGRSPIFNLFEDVAMNDPEALKTHESHAFRRAAVELGIGRELYFLKGAKAIFCPDGKYSHYDRNSRKSYRWNPPKIADIKGDEYDIFISQFGRQTVAEDAGISLGMRIAEVVQESPSQTAATAPLVAVQDAPPAPQVESEQKPIAAPKRGRKPLARTQAAQAEPAVTQSAPDVHPPADSTRHNAKHVFAVGADGPSQEQVDEIKKILQDLGRL